LDILNDEIEMNDDYDEVENIKNIKEFKNDQVEVLKDWKEVKNVTTVYKLSDIQVPIFGIQTKAEKTIKEAQTKRNLKVHRTIYGTCDEWINYELKKLKEMEMNIWKRSL
jgi:hypothetical protein